MNKAVSARRTRTPRRSATTVLAAFALTISVISSVSSLSATSAAAASSPPSSPASVSPNAPATPVAVAGNTQAEITWSAPTSPDAGEQITGYTVTSFPGNLTCSTAGATSCSITGLTNGTSYRFSVASIDSTGASFSSQLSNAVTPGTIPDSPTNVVATAGNSAVGVTWTQGSNGGRAITSYTVTAQPGGFSCSSTVPSSTLCTVTHLTNGTSYSFSVVATNAFGSSVASSTATATPVAVPYPVPFVTAYPLPGGATVSWSPAISNGLPISKYVATASPGGASCTATTGTKCSIAGLTNGTAYTFTVKAVNALGVSLVSPASAPITPVAAPSAPTAVSAQALSEAALVSWTAPAANGSVITGYNVSSSPSGFSCSTTGATSCTVTGLTDGTSYSFSITALSAVGSSPAASSPAVVPTNVPGAPTSVSAVASNGTIAASWTAPANHGLAISTYTATAQPGGYSCTSSTTKCTILGLYDGQAYVVTVTATNAAGSSAASAPSAAITPYTVPTAPLYVTGTPGNASVALHWSLPASTGGSAITKYVATSTPGGLSCSSTSAPSCTVTGLTNGTSYSFSVVAYNAAGQSLASSSTRNLIPATTPGAPTSVLATALPGAAKVSWTAPASNGGSAIYSYTVTSSPGGFSCSAAGPSGCAVLGLTDGVSYSFSVVAVNAMGTSSASVPSAPTNPATAPAAPVAISASPGNGSATVSWTAPVSNGGSPVSSYTVTASPGGFSCSTSSTNCTVTGLSNGTAYTFTVTSTNAMGSSRPSAGAPSVTPATTPGAPTTVVAQTLPGAANVTWAPPSSNGGAVITSYTVTAQPGGFSCSTPSTHCAVLGLTDGVSYSFTVTASNWAGSSASSAAATVIPSTIPTAPQFVKGAAGNGSITLLWFRPASNGASAITGYTATDGQGDSCVTSTTSCVISGLSNGTSYSFSVTATNAMGTGPAATSPLLVPMTTPDAPQITSAQAGNGSALISWSTPANGGSAITGYTVSDGQGDSCTTTEDLCVISGLTNGQSYSFSVTSTNAAGDSAASSPANVTPATAPDAPSGIITVSANASATVSWTAPFNEGSAITGYVVSDGQGHSCTTSTTSCTVSGLSNGSAYVFSVTAVNALGQSFASLSNPVTPASAPDAPSAVTATSGDSSASVSWTAPFDEGSAITSYTVTDG